MEDKETLKLIIDILVNHSVLQKLDVTRYYKISLEYSKQLAQILNLTNRYLMQLNMVNLINRYHSVFSLYGIGTTSDKYVTYNNNLVFFNKVIT